LSSSDITQISLLTDSFNSGSYLAASTADHIPNNYSQAMASDKPLQWQLAANKEIPSLEKNDVFVPSCWPKSYWIPLGVYRKGISGWFDNGKG
jgi:hypothetical protein